MLRSVLLPVLATLATVSPAAAATAAKPAATAATSPAESPAAQNLRAAEKQWASYDAQATGCAFTTTAVDVFQRREVALQRALTKLQDPKANVAPIRVAPVGCFGPFHGEIFGATMITTWDWLTRLEFYSQFTSTADWPQGIAKMGGFAMASHRDLKTGLTDSLTKTNGKNTMDQRAEVLRNEVVAVMMLMCRERRPTATNCPALPDSLKGQEPQARARLAEIERAAAQLRHAAAQDMIGAIGIGWRLQKDPSDKSTTCAPGDRVIYPHAKEVSRTVMPGQLHMQLRDWGLMTPTNINNSENLVTVQETADGYQLLYSKELNVGFRDPVKRKFIPCEAF